MPVDFSDNKPIYRQIVDFSVGRILTGEWVPGNRIPSVRELAVELAVNTHTVLKAFEFLQTESIIQPKRGMGFYLAEDALEKVNSLRRRDFFETTLPALKAEMELLGISPEEVAHFLTHGE